MELLQIGIIFADLLLFLSVRPEIAALLQDSLLAADMIMRILQICSIFWELCRCSKLANRIEQLETAATQS
ncbi:hypothetical protein WJ0W_001444 [Paenibacillus melissococcoides]|uniref:Uncharacterized protein n=1 Tax=Paenibacillus melissococcoides TaxID=2912268 RepID=A0ABN8TZJ1_9BACL|nr:hypothetical protein WJ0W_001444 [Paenibacillus melissococcoides]